MSDNINFTEVGDEGSKYPHIVKHFAVINGYDIHVKFFEKGASPLKAEYHSEFLVNDSYHQMHRYAAKMSFQDQMAIMKHVSKVHDAFITKYKPHVIKLQAHDQDPSALLLKDKLYSAFAQKLSKKYPGTTYSQDTASYTNDFFGDVEHTMSFPKSLTEAVKRFIRLYHGTARVRNTLASIKKHGLIPKIGPLTASVHGEDEGQEPVVHLAGGGTSAWGAQNEYGLERAVAAMHYHIARKFGQNWHTWTPTKKDIENHGVIFVVNHSKTPIAHLWKTSDEGEYQSGKLRPLSTRKVGDKTRTPDISLPHGVEAGQYYTRNRVKVSGILKGKRLVAFLDNRGHLEGYPDTHQIERLDRYGRRDLYDTGIATFEEFKKRRDQGWF